MALNTVNNNAIFDERWQLAFNLNAAIVVGDVGKVVSLDVAGPNRAKLAVADEAIIGRLEVFEDRQTGKVGTINTRGICSVPTTGAVAVGDTLVGSATPGVAKAAAEAAHNVNVVLEVDAGNNRAVVWFK